MLCWAAPAHATTRTIYSSLPLDGAERPQAEDVMRGEQLALAAAGGVVGGVGVRLISLDDATERAGGWDPLATARDARTAVEDPATIAYLGEFNSAASAIAIPILNDAGIPQVSPSNRYVGLTRGEAAERGEPDKYYPTGRRTFVRVAPADHLQAAAIVAYLRRLRARRIFVVDAGDLYGRGIAAMVRRRLGRLRLVGRATYRGEATRIADRARRRGVDAMVFGGTTDDGAARLFTAVHRRAPRAALVGDEGVADERFARRLPRGTAARTFITNPFLAPSDYPPQGRFFDAAFRASFGHEPQPLAKYGFEAMALVLDAMRRAGPAAADREAVRRQLFGTRDRDSVLGRYSIDRNGDTTLATYGSLRIRRGRLVFDRVLRSR